MRTMASAVNDEPDPVPTDRIAADSVFTEFYRAEHAGQVRRAALMLGSSEEANDIVHEALAAMYGRWDLIDHPGPYLNRAVLNGCRAAANRRRADLRVRKRLRVEVETSREETLLDIIKLLPFNQRAAIVLRFYAQMTEHDIAITLDVPQGSIGPWINRALTTMRKELS